MRQYSVAESVMTMGSFQSEHRKAPAAGLADGEPEAPDDGRHGRQSQPTYSECTLALANEYPVGVLTATRSTFLSLSRVWSMWTAMLAISKSERRRDDDDDDDDDG